MVPGQEKTWYQRLRQRWVDRAAQRTFERLLANPASFRSAPSAIAATAVAVMIIVAVAAFLALLVWGSLHASGMGWILVAIGWLVVIALRPQSAKLPSDTTVLDPAEYPGIHRLVREMADAVGVRSPRTVAVDLGLNAYVTTVGLLARPAMVLGLPLMTLSSWHARLGIIGHELGHLRGRDTTRGRIESAASGIVGGLQAFLAPERRHRDELYWRTGLFSGGVVMVVAQVLQSVLAAPFLLLGALLDRLSLGSRPHHEYLADRRAAEVVGSDSMIEFFVEDLESVRTVTASAARRGEDPFDVLAGRPRPTPARREARIRELVTVPHRADATHPRDDLRIKLLLADPRPPGPSMPTEGACLRAEEELEQLRRARAAAYSTLLVHDLA